MKTRRRKPPPIPKHFGRKQKVEFWGREYTVTPAVANSFVGDGQTLLYFTPLATRPNWYLIRVDSSWGKWTDGTDGHDHIDEVIDALIDDFRERERERENLELDLIERGIKPTAENTDLAGNEEVLGFPVLCLDCGCSWGVEARWDGRVWRKQK